MSLIWPLQSWHWLLLGVGLAIAEALLPGAYLIWFGVASGLVGLAMLALPTLAWQAQFILFAALSLALILLWRRYGGLQAESLDHPNLNRRGMQYVGRRFTLDDPLVNGHGKIRVDDTTWKVVGDDAPAGALVEVDGVEGTQLRVTVVEQVT